MKALDIVRLQLSSPYTIVREGDEYLFRTDRDILYAVSFQIYDAIPGLTAYWFDLSNRSHRASPNDAKVRETVIAIIEEFFYQNRYQAYVHKTLPNDKNPSTSCHQHPLLFALTFYSPSFHDIPDRS